jgi:protein SCO1/2
MKTRILRVAFLSSLGLVLAAAVAWWQMRPVSDAGAASASALALGGPFHLTDHTGRAVSEADYRGKFLLVYFGYTFCPDVCPTELQTIAQALDQLGPAADRIQPLFVTIDPARDTAKQLATYVALFSPRLVGLTGTPDQVAAMAREYRVYYARADGATPETYSMDHSSFVYLMAPDGRFLEVFGRDTAPETLAAALRARLGG